MFSNRWISENIFSISEEEFVRNQREKFYDKKLEAAMAKIAQATVEEGGGAFGGGFGLGGATETGVAGELESPEEAPEETPEVTEPEPEAAPAAAEEPEGLLVAPATEEAPAAPAGKRDEDWYRVMRTSDGKTTTSKSKGKFYTPAVTDKRDMGARRKNYLGMSGVEQGGTRKSHKGYHELNSLAKGVVNESNYNDEVERKVLLASKDINDLIGSLEKNKNETKS